MRAMGQNSNECAGNAHSRNAHSITTITHPSPANSHHRSAQTGLNGTSSKASNYRFSPHNPHHHQLAKIP